MPIDKPGKKAIPLDGRTWLRYSISIWDDIKSGEERSYKHPALFPISLTDRLVEIFGHKARAVLDPFMGSGSTICSAYKKGVPSVGFEISEKYITLARERLQAIQGPLNCYPRIIKSSSLDLLQYVEPESVGLCITSPPYWNILNQKRTADGKSVRNYGSDPADLGNIENYATFLGLLKKVFAGVYTALISGAYCIVIVMDLRKKANFYPLHMDLTIKLKELGFTFDDMIIWDRRQEYNNLRPLGYPYVFRINKTHEYILIFQKRQPG